ncbi:MAG: Gfo/Idh/MocA family oxidoreductase [Actinobacteria bacterium]|nr:Gfo/Idh/MocA family oxidoreductase [Actinomycetota bacterium]
MTHTPLRIAVVGTRGQAMRVAVPTVQLSENAILVGVIGSDPQRTRDAAIGWNVKAYESADQLIASGEVDAVWVTVPNYLHVDVAIKYLGGGINVLLEKPMSTTVEHANKLLEVSKSTSAVLKVAYQHRFRDAHRQLRSYLLEGNMGEIGSMRLHRYWKFPYFPNQDASELSKWRQSPEESGGWAINDIGCHLVDLMLWISPEPVEFLDGFFTRRYPGVSMDSSVFLTLRMGKTSLMNIETSNVLESPGSLLEIYGEKGWVRSFNSFQDSPENETSFAGTSTFSTTSQRAYLEMLNDFIDACRSLASMGANFEDGLKSVALVEEARKRSRFLEDL